MSVEKAESWKLGASVPAWSRAKGMYRFGSNVNLIPGRCRTTWQQVWIRINKLTLGLWLTTPSKHDNTFHCPFYLAYTLLPVLHCSVPVEPDVAVLKSRLRV